MSALVASLDWGHLFLWLAGMVFTAVVEDIREWPNWRRALVVALWPAVATAAVLLVAAGFVAVWTKRTFDL